MDAFARGLEVAHALLTASPLETWRRERYASFDAGEGKDFAQGQATLVQLAPLAARRANHNSAAVARSLREPAEPVPVALILRRPLPR